jgi:PPOX class probable FMN-dependent enzyme
MSEIENFLNDHYDQGECLARIDTDQGFLEVRKSEELNIQWLYTGEESVQSVKSMYLKTEMQLREIYGHPKGRAKDKVLSCLDHHSTHFIEKSPFVTLSTYGDSGLPDSSPRGGDAGFVKIINENTIVIPDGKGNNRLDSLVNIIETGGVGCLFLIPGVDETLRINGTARISTNDAHLNLFSDNKNAPKVCIEIKIKEVFLHCAKALMRSKLWSPEAQIERSSFPTMGVMLKDQLATSEMPESQEDMITRYKKDL